MKKATRNKYTILVIALLIVVSAVALIFFIKNKSSQALGSIKQNLFFRQTKIRIGDESPTVLFSRYFPPYIDNRTGLHHALKDRKGVYLIMNSKTGKVEYVGNSASDLYKTMYRHFQSWKDKQQYRATFSKNGYLTRVILIEKPEHIYELEKYYIHKYKPKANEQKYLSYELDFVDLKTIESNNWIKQIDYCPF